MSTQVDSQLAQACQRCWRRKQKCSRQIPVCAECDKAKAECVPRIWGLQPGTEEPGSSRSAIEYLKSRIAFLEQQQPSASPNTHRRGLSPETLGQPQPLGTSTDETFDLGNRSPRDAANEVEYLSVAAMGEPSRLDIQHGGLSFTTLVEETMKLGPPFVKSPHTSHVEQRRSHGSMLQAQQDLVHATGHSFDYFFESYCSGLMHKMYPCISYPSCRAAVDCFSQQGTGAVQNGEFTSIETAAFITCTTVALGINNSQYHRAASLVSEQLAGTAVQLLSSLVNQISDTESVRYLLLAALLCASHFTSEPTWHLVGLAVTKAISAGLHRSSGDGDDADLFWTLYKFDRALALTTGRPLSIEDGDITVRMPQLNAHAAGSSDLALRGLFTWTVHYAHMMSSWRHQSPVDLESCEASLEYWQEACSESTLLSRHAATIGGEKAFKMSTVARAQSQCRALAYVWTLALTETPAVVIPPDLQARLSTKLGQDLTNFLESYRAALEDFVIVPTMHDVLDIVGAVISLITGRHLLYLKQASGSASGLPATGVATMRLVTLTMEVLQKLGQRASSVLEFQGVIWSILSVIENSSRPSHDGVDEPQLEELKVALSKIHLPLPERLIGLVDQIVG